MNKSAIQKFAVQARRDLIEQVKQQAFNYGIDENGYGDKNAVSVNGNVLSSEKKSQRMAFITAIESDGYEQVIEKVAYTWFNRFIALRFMEVNDYLPTHIRVLSNETGAFKPEILKHATTIELLDKNGNNLVNKERVFELLENPEGTEDLYRYLLLTQCKSLHYSLPKMFESISINDFTELLLPLKILSDESVIAHLVNDIDENDFNIVNTDDDGRINGQVEIIGWLYQYYNTEPKDKVFANLKKNIKISKENIPAATQLFTPDWIVRYMVENSLGRIAVEKLSLDPKAMGWKYYLEEAEQTNEVKNQLAIINGDKKDFKLEELKVIDPCMGSGHILVYAFDVLMQIYESQGYISRDAVASILENNLFGLDIDERAYQLSYFALMMKARANDRRFLTREIAPQVYCPKGYADGEEYGSLLNVDELEAMPQEKDEITLFEESYEKQLNTWNFRRLLNQKYDVVVTNPPYMGSKGMSAKLSKYVQDNYSDSKSDMFAVFIERSLEMAKKNGYSAMITPQSFFFLKNLEALRKNIICGNIITNAIHMGLGAFGNDFGTVAFIISNMSYPKFKSTFLYLGKEKSSEDKNKDFLEGNYSSYNQTMNCFLNIPNSTFSYMITEHTMSLFNNSSLSENYISGGRNKTHNDDKYLRLWWEIHNNISKWVSYGKGGEYRKWYGNILYVVDWSESATNFYKSHGGLCNEKFWNKKGITWSFVTSYKPSFRKKNEDMIYSSVSPTIFCHDFIFRPYHLGLLNSSVGLHILKIISSTIGTNVGEVLNFPVVENSKKETAETLVQQNIYVSKTDWDSFETSWDFMRHPLISLKNSSTFTVIDSTAQTEEKSHFLQFSYNMWENECSDRFNTLKRNEEELNRIFIDIYGLQDELTPEVEDKDVTVRLADKTRDIKSFISYAVGCMFGRYSLDVDGLAYAGGEFDNSKYTSFIPDMDNIIPICDDEYFEDDIVGRFIKFVEEVYGTVTLEENLEFIVSALGTKGTAREVIRNYFLNGFYADHCKTYSKRPIYWQFDSGKKNGFKALIYMHRYESNLLARMRTDYVHEQQERYRTQIAHVEDMLLTASNKDKAVLTKTNKKLAAQAQEILKFEEKVHHLADQKISIDLDDGVVKNYALFSDVVTKIK